MGKEHERRRKAEVRSYAKYSKEILNIAVDLVKSKKLSSYEAQKKFGIPRRTLLNRAKNFNIKPFGRQKFVSESDEKYIADMVKAAKDSDCLTIAGLQKMVFDYLKKNERTNLFKDKMPGPQWVRGFLSRHNISLKGSSKATKTQERAVVNDEKMEMEIQIKVKDSPENSDVEESTLFEAEEVETQTFHTSKRNQNTTIDDSDDDKNESGEDSNPCVDPLIPSSHLQKRNRSLVKTEDFIPDGGETQSQNTCQCGDEFRIYGEYVASQLKQLSIEESLLARDKIQSILTQSRLKDLKRKKNVYSQ